MTTNDTQSWKVLQDGKQIKQLKKQLPLSETAFTQLITETSKILSLCGSPELPECAETGLVLGYVQSGKTMSFTTLIAMARDNGYQIIIVLAGTQTVLVDQSVKRLTKDLQIEGTRDWRIVSSTDDDNNLDDIETTLREYKRSGTLGQRRRATIVVVTKNAPRISQLCEVIERLSEGFTGVPTLIVDDEADQAGLNNQAQKNRQRKLNGEPEEETAVYSQLMRLKKALPHHSYVQYTATPQALLFISRNDKFSPNFIKLLTPGSDYTGGETFFTPPQFYKLVKVVPEEEAYTTKHPITEIPETLKEALRVFFIGAADFLVKDESGNRSMIVHPSQRRDIHKTYFDWVNTLKSTWERLLDKPDDDPHRQRLVADFEFLYNELRDGSSELASFQDLLAYLPEAIASTKVKKVNAAAGATPKIKWNSNDFFILVGGQAMSRGYTVEGLTVTYMPRSVGTGAADSMQQWARFFGYKKSYLHLCRIYLLDKVRKAFSGYVIHEEDLRIRLQEHDASRTLKEFARIVKLPFTIKQLTRKSVLSEDLERVRFGSSAKGSKSVRGIMGNWTTTTTVQGSPSEIQDNSLTIKSFIDKLKKSWKLDKGNDQRTDFQKHLTAQVPLTEILDLLRAYVYLSTDDADKFSMLANGLQQYISLHPDAQGASFQMSPLKQRTRTAPNGKLSRVALFQGANPAKDGGSDIYPGDYFICDEKRISIQIHRLKVDTEGNEFDTFALAVWVPSTEPLDMVKLANE
jgi:hypothetical protein